MRFPGHYKSTDWIRKHNVLGLVQLVRFLVVSTDWIRKHNVLGLVQLVRFLVVKLI
jgi:hypothetical protein